jgi:hypothetical protein
MVRIFQFGPQVPAKYRVLTPGKTLLLALTGIFRQFQREMLPDFIFRQRTES